MLGLSKGFADPRMASTSQECGSGREVEERTLRVTLLGSEWRSSTDGDVSTINRELAIQLAKQPNVQVSVYVPQCSEEDNRSATNHNVHIIEAEEVLGIDPVDWLINIPENHAMDCIVGHGVRLGRQIPLIKRHHHCKWIQVVHTAPEEHGMYKSISEGAELQQTEIELCREADQVVAVGPKLEDAYKRHLRSGKKYQDVLDLTPGIFTEFLDVQQATEERETFCVLVIMSGESEDFILKGYDLAAQAIAELKDKSYQLRITCPPTEKGEKMAERLLQHGIARSQLIVRRFNESREERARLFCEVDLDIMPSRSEGFGLTALEALSAGLPVLVSGNSGLGKALKKVPHGSPCVVDSEDPRNWAKAIKAVRQKDRDVRLDESKCLRDKYSEKYSWQKPCDLLVARMRDLVFGSAGLLPSSVECSQMPSNVTSQTYRGPYNTQNMLKKCKEEIHNISAKLKELKDNFRSHVGQLANSMAQLERSISNDKGRVGETCKKESNNPETYIPANSNFGDLKCRLKQQAGTRKEETSFEKVAREEGRQPAADGNDGLSELTEGRKQQAEGPKSAAPIQKKTHDAVNRADAAEVDCIICCVDTATVTFQPCGHTITCTGCSLKSKRCLTCNAAIQQKITNEGAQVGALLGATNYLERVRRLEERLRVMEDDRQCQICMERDQNMVFLCGHGACQECSDKLQICHVCREAIQNRIQMY